MTNQNPELRTGALDMTTEQVTRQDFEEGLREDGIQQPSTQKPADIPISILSDLRFALNDLEHGFTICEACGHQTNAEDSPMDCTPWVRNAWAYLHERYTSAQQTPEAPASGEVVDAIDIKTRIGNWVKAVVADCRKNNAFLCNSEGRLVQEGFEKALGLVEAKVEYFTPPAASQVPEGWSITRDDGDLVLKKHGDDSYGMRMPSATADTQMAFVTEFLLALLTTTPEAGDGWKPYYEYPEIGKPVLGYHSDWIDEDFCADGIRECFTFGDGSEWQSARWDGYADLWVVEDGAPELWHPHPQPPQAQGGSEA